MNHTIPLEEIIADIARKATIEHFGDYEDLIWHHYYFCDTSYRYTWLHWDDCYEGCGCPEMTYADILHLLPHHQEITPLRGYARKYPVDNTKHQMKAMKS